MKKVNTLESANDSFDKRRKLEGHRVNLEEKFAKGETPEGNCELCADAWCLLNVTKKLVLDKLAGTLDVNSDGFDEIHSTIWRYKSCFHCAYRAS